MPIKVGVGVLDLVVDDSGLDKGLAAGEKKSASWLKKLAGGMTKTLAVGVASAGAVITGLGVTMGKLALDALPLQGISDAFRGITGDAGETMAALREGSLGMVKDTELMRSYNDAAQLVSKTFADQLPDAMQYLSKISAATGDDMGYLMDSLVKGVGRMSGPILDNLKIQVDAAMATERATEMYGLQADQLNKTQIQAGMMSVVLEKLAENTAAMPEVTGTAAHQWAAFRTDIANVKDEIGLALLPAFQTLMGTLGEFARKYLPDVIGLIKTHLVPAIEMATAWLGEELPKAMAFLEEHSEEIVAWLKALGIGFGVAAVAATGFVIATSPVILPILAIAAAVALLATAWIEDWGGIQTTLTAFWEETARPILELIYVWFTETLPEALVTIRDWFAMAWTNITTTLSDAWNAAVAIFENVKLWFTITMPNALRQAWEDVKATLRAALAAVKQRVFNALTWLSNFWQETWNSITGFFRAVWDTIRVILLTALILILDIFGIKLEDLLAKWRTTWDAAIAWLSAAWNTIKTTVSEAAQAVYDFVKGQLDNIGESWTLAWGLVSGKATEIWATIKTTVGDAAKAVWGYVSAQLDLLSEGWTLVWDAVSTKASEIWETIKTTVGDAAKAVWTILAGWYEDIKAAVTDPLTDAWQAIKDTLEDWKDLGKSLVGGIVSGITDKAKDIINAIKDAIKDAIKRAKGLIGAWSPSRVFAEIGGSMMEGMALGIQQYASMPAAAMALATQQVITTTETHYHLQYYGAHQTQANIRDIIRSLEIGSR